MRFSIYSISESESFSTVRNMPPGTPVPAVGTTMWLTDSNPGLLAWKVVQVIHNWRAYNADQIGDQDGGEAEIMIEVEPLPGIRIDPRYTVMEIRRKQQAVSGMDSRVLVPEDEYETKYFRKGVEAFIAGESYAILTTDSEWRRGWSAAESAAAKLEG